MFLAAFTSASSVIIGSRRGRLLAERETGGMLGAIAVGLPGCTDRQMYMAIPT